MTSQIFRIAPMISIVDSCFDVFATISADVLISSWIVPAPKPVSLVGPFELHDLTDAKAVRSHSHITDLPQVDREVLGSVEAHLSAALQQSGFDRVREPGFADRVFAAHGFWAFAYDAVCEHLAVTRTDDYDADRTLLDPILSARTLTILASRDTVSDRLSRVRFQRAIQVIEHMLLRGNGIMSAEFDLSHLHCSQPTHHTEKQLHWLRRKWRRLVEVDLPDAARSRSWPVQADHCLARILLDHACGRPWRETITPPAWRNAPFETLTTAVLAGERALAGDTDLHDLNRQSLSMRGKLG